MKQSDLFNELIGISDPEQRAKRIAEIAESNPELAADLRSMLENYTPNETFLEESIPEIISKPQYEEIGEKIRRIEAPNQQTTNTPVVSNRPSPDVTKHHTQ